MKTPIAWLIALSALAAGGWWARQKFPETFSFERSETAAASRKPQQAATAVVTVRDIHFAITAAGDIGPVDTVSVRPEVGGIISKLTLDIGDKVKKGDVLFELDDKDLQTEKSTRQIEIAGAKLAIETQRIHLEKSKLGFERAQELFTNKLLSQEAFDNMRLDYELTKNTLSIASNRLETAESALQQVEDKLGKTVIRAPFDCTILTRPVSVGQAVSGATGFNSGTEVFSIANLADMIITAHINQADVTRLKVEQPVSVEVEAVPGLKLKGHVNRIAPQATFRNGIKGYSTRVILKNAEAAVRPGMTASLSIPLVSAGDVLAVPLAAVFNEQSERFVYVQKVENRFERRVVELGVSDYNFAEVTKGLNAGEVVSLIAPPSEATAAGAKTPIAKK
jgi:HlyD family secretion protein